MRVVTPLCAQKPSFMIFMALLSLMNDNDEDADAAVEGLLCCVQLPDPRVAAFIVQHTSFASELVGHPCALCARRRLRCDAVRPVASQVAGLRALYERLPQSLDAVEGGQRNEHVQEDLPADGSPLARAFALFFRRLQLVDVVVATTHPQVAAVVCDAVRREFLATAVQPALLHMEERVAVWTTVYVRHMLQQIEALPLQVSCSAHHRLHARGAL